MQNQARGKNRVERWKVFNEGKKRGVTARGKNSKNRDQPTSAEVSKKGLNTRGKENYQEKPK